MSKKQKIAFVGNSALTMLNFRLGVMKALSKRYEVVMITPQDCDLSALQGTSIRFIRIDIECKGQNPFHDYQLYRQYKKIYQQEGFDFIFHFTIKSVIYGSMAAGVCNIPHISVVTGLGYTFIKRNWLYRLSCFLHRVALRKAKAVWFLNQEDCDCFVRLKLVNPRKVYVMHGEGVDTSFFSTKHTLPQNVIFLYCGRMLRYKGVELFMKAAEVLKKEYPTAKWQLLGPFDALDPSSITPVEMEQWVQHGIVEYLCVSTDVRPYIEQCSCMVLPSYFREGVPRSLMEAASMQRPIIATNSVGCKDVVIDGVNGFLCYKGSLEDLIAKMSKILVMQPEALQTMGQRGRELMLRSFDEKITIQHYIDVCNRYLA